jgi:hypothetical protein
VTLKRSHVAQTLCAMACESDLVGRARKEVAVSIETLDDIIEEILDALGIYGAHNDDVESDGDKCNCRCCRSSSLRQRIEAAVEVDRKMRG